MSAIMEEAEHVAKQIYAELRADDPRFSRAVMIWHEEGTQLFFMHAFIMEWDMPFFKDETRWFMVSMCMIGMTSDMQCSLSQYTSYQKKSKSKTYQEESNAKV